jgi:hypothetical protein
MVNQIIVNNLKTKKKKVKRLSASNLNNSINNNGNNNYYPSAFISNPCDQLFGPQPFGNYSALSSITYNDASFNNIGASQSSIDSYNLINDELSSSYSSHLKTFSQSSIDTVESLNSVGSFSSNYNSTNKTAASAAMTTTAKTKTTMESEVNQNINNEYIPAPKWNKSQNSILEDLFKTSRYPKKTELKSLAQRLHVMDSDIEVIRKKRKELIKTKKSKINLLKSILGMVQKETRSRQKNKKKK